MDVNSLVDAAAHADFAPLFDPPSTELAEVVSEVARITGGKPRTLPPGNDQHSHALEWQLRERLYKLYLRFDRRICSAVVYAKQGTARSFLTGDAGQDAGLRAVLEALIARGFEYVGFGEAQIDLGERPLEQGHVANTLFAYWFEDP